MLLKWARLITSAAVRTSEFVDALHVAIEHAMQDAQADEAEHPFARCWRPGVAKDSCSLAVCLHHHGVYHVGVK